MTGRERPPSDAHPAAPGEGAAKPADGRQHVRTRDDAPVVDDTPLIPDRSVDDSDVGWNDGGDSNDERLRRDVPPHW